MGPGWLPDRLRLPAGPRARSTSPISPRRSSEDALDDAGVDTADVGVIRIGNALRPARRQPEASSAASPPQSCPSSGTSPPPATRPPAPPAASPCSPARGRHRVGPIRLRPSALGLGTGADRPRRRRRRPSGGRRPGSATRAGDTTFMWPHMFSALTDGYDRRYGVEARPTRREIARLNFSNAGQPPRPDPHVDLHPRELRGRRRRQPDRRGW